MENLKANIKNLSKNKIYLILIGLTVVFLATVLIYAYVEFLSDKISMVQTEEGKPYCGAIGSRSEGWYINSDSNRPELIRWDNCDGCYAVCKAIGTRSEGWYVSGNCDSGLNLIKYDNCSATSMECNSDADCQGGGCPQVIGGDKAMCDLKTNQCYCGGVCGDGYCDPIEKKYGSCPKDCGKISVCAKEGEQVNRNPLMGSTDKQCCPGLIENRVSKSYSICEKTTSLCEDLCGDGICQEIVCLAAGCPCAETAGSCPADCKEDNKECYTDADCKGGVCPQVIGGDKPMCDLKTNQCYCGGVCGDGYCDPIEKKYGSCPKDCGKISVCAKEGEQVNRNPLLGSNDKQCCSGLVENRVSKSYSICEKPIEDCAKEGEKNYFGKPSCCEGLTQISNFAIAESNPIQCIVVPDGSGFCTKCGDGICKSPENICNCPEDCKEETKSITVISPNGGEKWEIGGTYDITWESSNTVENVVIDLYDCNNLPCKSTAISPGISAAQGKYSWNITVYDPGDKYKIQVTSIELGQFGGVTRKNISDQSDNYFSIVASDNLVELEGKIVVIAEGSMSESWGIEVEQGPAGYIGETIGFCGDLTVLGLDIELFRNKRISVSIEPRIDCFSMYQKTGRVLKWEECEDEDCIPEGSSVDTSGMQKCCAGLKAISCARPNSQGECHNEDFNCDSFPCANCGNGICGLGENKCNCPEDCKEEETLSADLNCDGNVNLTDAAILLSFWNKDPSGATSCKSPDINQDGKVNLADFSIMMSQWTTLL